MCFRVFVLADLNYSRLDNLCRYRQFEAPVFRLLPSCGVKLECIYERSSGFCAC